MLKFCRTIRWAQWSRLNSFRKSQLLPWKTQRRPHSERSSMGLPTSCRVKTTSVSFGRVLSIMRKSLTRFKKCLSRINNPWTKFTIWKISMRITCCQKCSRFPTSMWHAWPTRITKLCNHRKKITTLASLEWKGQPKKAVQMSLAHPRKTPTSSRRLL